MRILRVFSDNSPTQYAVLFHHGFPKLLAQSERGQEGGTWMNLPIGVYGIVQPVIESTWVLSCEEMVYCYAGIFVVCINSVAFHLPQNTTNGIQTI